MKRKIKIGFIVAFSLLLVFFSRELSLEFFGWLAKWGVQLQSEGRFAYRSLEWREGKLVFHDPVFFDSQIHLRAEQIDATFSFDYFPKMVSIFLEVNKPHVTLLNPEKSKKGGWPTSSSGWIDLNFKLNDGLVEWEKMGIKARMEAEKLHPHQLGRLSLFSGPSHIHFEAFREGKQIRLDGAFSQFEARILQPWASLAGLEWEIEGGQLNGWIHLESSQEGITGGSAHIEGAELAGRFRERETRLKKAQIDWNGSTFCEENRLLQKGAPLGRIRFDCSGGQWNFLKGPNIGEIDASFSYSSDLGAKWEFAAVGEVENSKVPFTFEGRSFWEGQRDPWLDAKLKFPQSLTALQAKVEKGHPIWKLTIDALQPSHGEILQEIGSLWIPYFQEWDWKGGAISAEAQWETSRWQIISCKGNDLIFQHFADTFSLREISSFYDSEGKRGGIDLEGGEGVFTLAGNGQLKGEDWSASLLLDQGEVIDSKWRGKINQLPCEGSLMGGADWSARLNFDEYSAELKGQWDWRFLKVDSIHVKSDRFLAEGQGILDMADWKTAPFSFAGGKISSDLSRISPFTGSFESTQFYCRGNLFDPIQGWDFELIGEVKGAAIDLGADCRIEEGAGLFTIRKGGWFCEKGRGDLIHSLPTGASKLKIHCTSLYKEEDLLKFDLSLCENFIDLVRVVGEERGGIISFDPAKSEIFGSPLEVDPCIFSSNGIEKFNFKTHLPIDSLRPLTHFLSSFGLKLPKIKGEIALSYSYDDRLGSSVDLEGVGLNWNGQQLPFSFLAKQNREKGWKIEKGEVADFCFGFDLSFNLDAWALRNGTLVSKKGLFSKFTARIDPLGKMQLKISDLDLELPFLLPYFRSPLPDSQGSFKGQGCITYDFGSQLHEIDLDLIASDLQAGPYKIENQGPLYIYHSSEKGFIFKGIDFQADVGDFSSPLNGKIDLLQYGEDRWIFSQFRLHLPQSFLSMLLPPHLSSSYFGSIEPIDTVVDLECASDYSWLTCKFKEGSIPFQGSLRHLKDFKLNWDLSKISAHFSYFHQGREIGVGFSSDRAPISSGRLTLEDLEYPLTKEERPLSIDWQFDPEGGLAVRSIEGVFGGVDASFHAEESIDEKSQLIGTARLDFIRIAQIAPQSIGEAFRKLEMGRGYELKGRLSIDKNRIDRLYFEGIVGGKQLELFGYQLRTLLGRITIEPEKIRIYNTKISDSAGLLKIDEILMQEGENRAPWTLSIPSIAISEFRPSLLQKVGGPPGEISPLVIRSMKIENLTGLLEEANTYRAFGELNFINSYKREHTVLDIPSDFLGRIIGLDVELLIPVRGKLHYQLYDGAFHLTDLEEAFSEGGRSQFFLVPTENSPLVDLDGNLNIHVKMKQFVLFKLTEAFVISIDGKLNDPQYHLQKKNRFLGL